ncbi:MAG: sigma-70 family RNA polymerase sigma factor [Minisyncoccia bacterium]|jgi:RNA polymerase primary sigma factor
MNLICFPKSWTSNRGDEEEKYEFAPTNALNTSENSEDGNKERPGYSNILRIYLNEIGKLGRHKLTRHEERALMRLYKNHGDTRAFDELVNRHLKMVISIAKGHRNRGLDFLDLIQEGNIGLMKTPDKQSLSVNYRLSSYAYGWIKAEIGIAILNFSHTIKIPVRAQERFQKITEILAHFVLTEGRTPSIKEIQKASGYPVKTIINIMLNLPVDTISLEEVVSWHDEEPLTIGSVLASSVGNRQLDPEYRLLARSELNCACAKIRELVALLKSFPDYFQNLFRLRYGLDGTFEVKTLQEVADRCNRGRRMTYRNIAKIWRNLPSMGFEKNALWLIGEIERITNLIELADSSVEEANLVIFSNYDIEKRSFASQAGS